MKKIYLPIAPGSEEMEITITADVLRRAGFLVQLASIGPERAIQASRDIEIVADAPWSPPASDNWDAIVIPGGMGGVNAMRAHTGVISAIRQFAAAGKWVAAICAGPLVLYDAGVLNGKQFTCYPGCETSITGAAFQRQRVVIDAPILTSQGPGTAFDFALALVDALSNETPPLSERLAADMCL